MKPFALTLTLETLSPYHVGTGEGFASVIDKQTLSYFESGERLPIIYGQSIKGVIREQFEELQEVFSFPKEWIFHFFGSEKQMGNTYFSVFQLEQNMKEMLLRTEAGDGIFPVKYGNQISRRLKTAKKEHLFSIEHTEKAFLFEGTMKGSVKAEETDKLPASLIFLLLAVMNTKKFGGRRHTGAGECQFHLHSLVWNERTMQEEEVKQLIESEIDRMSRGDEYEPII